ncbi:MAG: hypothetical protein KDA71_10700 [Planctomycetales bacterium]|nr:hypothetical protein [Planctomycetales bacterium]
MKRLDLPMADGGESICEQQVRLAELNAKAIATANHVADQPVAPTSLTNFVFDINDTTCEPTPTTAYNGLKVTCEFNGITLFLSNILGNSKADLAITREARLDQRVYGFRPTATLPVRMCPIIYTDNWNFAVNANGVAGLITITVGDNETSGADSGRLCTLIPTTSSSTGQAFTGSQILLGLTVTDLSEFGGQFALTDTGMVRNIKAASPANSSVLQNVGNSLAGLPNNNRVIVPLGTEIDSSTRQITGFAAGRILSANYASSTLTVTVEPHLLLSGTALIDAGMPLNPYIGKLYVAP